MSDPIEEKRALPMLLTASGGCAMSLADTNIVAVTVPTLTQKFGADAVAGQWVISAFFLGFAASLMAAGAISDRFGRRRTYLWGLAGLALTALVCGIASSLILLQISRAFQGIATAFVLAPALAMVGHRFREPQSATRAWMIWGCVMGGTMVLAPLIGGALVQLFGWRAGFLINLPLCAGLFAATLAYTSESFGAAERRLDPAGILLFALAMFGLAWALINGQSHGWQSGSTLAGLTLGLLTLAGFVAVENIQSNPMIAPALFKNPAFVGAVWSMFAYAATAQVMASILPLYLQNRIGLSAAQTGLAVLPFSLAMLSFPFVGAWLGRRKPQHIVLPIGFLLVALGNCLAALGAIGGHWPILGLGMSILGGGAGILNGEGQRAIMATIPASHSGIASGISTTARFSGILLGFAALNAMASAARLIAAGPSPDMAHAATPHAGGLVDFAVVLGAAGGFALVSALVVNRLLRRQF